MELIGGFPVFANTSKEVNALLSNFFNFDLCNLDDIALSLELLFGMAIEVLLCIWVEDWCSGVVGEMEV